MRRRLLQILGSLAALVFLGLLGLTFVPAFITGASLSHSIRTRIDSATSIRIVEHSSRYDTPETMSDENFRETVYNIRPLSPPEISRLRAATPPSLDYSGSIFKACFFVPHHRIEAIQPDHSVYVVELCFKCDELQIDSGNKRIMPWGWSSNLKHFIRSIGLKPDGPWQAGTTP